MAQNIKCININKYVTYVDILKWLKLFPIKITCIVYNYVILSITIKYLNTKSRISISIVILCM